MENEHEYKRTGADFSNVKQPLKVNTCRMSEIVLRIQTIFAEPDVLSVLEAE